MIKVADSNGVRNGIRLVYGSLNDPVQGLKDGILLEAGLDDVTPNLSVDISSWAYDYAAERVAVIDNRAKAVACYDPGYTLIEKLQTISTKFRKQQEHGDFPTNLMRHHYDVYSLLKQPRIETFIGTGPYLAHKQKRFWRADNPVIADNAAFLLTDPSTRARYGTAYREASSFYYGAKPAFDEILAEIGRWAGRL